VIFISAKDENFKNDQNSSKQREDGANLQSILTKLLSDNVNMEIFMILVAQGEMTLNQLTDIVEKSRATVHRRIQKFIDAGIIDVNLIKKKGNIPTHHYKINLQKLMNQSQAQKNPAEMNAEEKKVFNEQLQLTYRSTISYIIKFLHNFDNFIGSLDTTNGGKFEQYNNFLDPKMFVSLGFQTEYQKQEYFKGFGKFLQDFGMKMTKEKLGLEEKKPYAMVHVLIPILELLNLKQNYTK